MYLSMVMEVIVRCHGFFYTTPYGYKIHVLYTYYSYPIKAYIIVLHDIWTSCVCALISGNGCCTSGAYDVHACYIISICTHVHISV